MSEQVYCVLDYETRSKAELKKTGAYEYSRHKSTTIMCVAWRVGTRKQLRERSTQTRVWSPAFPSDYGELKRALLNPDVLLVAHNAFFEQVITRFVLTGLIHNPELKEIPHERWICTASMARALALPGKLEGACIALSLPVQKDVVGHKLMLKLSKPRKPTKHNPAIWHQKKTDLLRLMEYCKTDVDAEVELFLAVPELIPVERKLWLLDQKVNLRGFHADRPLVKKIIGMIGEENVRFLRETKEITGGELENVTQRDAVLRFISKHGVFLPDLKAKTVSDALSGGLAGNGAARRILEIRQAASKASTAKYPALEMRSRTDSRVRDNQVYHAASTGRFGGAGFQPHNLPRGTIGDTDLAAEILSDPSTDLEMVRLLYGNPLDVFSSCLRSMIRASDGKELFGGDFAGIEVRVLFWVARHEAGLQAFRDLRDLYIEQATEIYKRKITKDDKVERQLGKKVILGAGFGLGKDRFFDSCKEDGIEITKELAASAIAAYRTTHSPVPKLWKNLERAAIAAVENRGKKYTINRTSWWVEGEFLYCELPSKRRLAYFGPSVKYRTTPWGEKKPTLHHFDVHPKTKKWVEVHTWGGTLTENVVQAVARDLMTEAMPRAEEKSYELLFTVHDELLAERDKGKGSEKEFEDLMSVPPTWAEGLPVKVEASVGLRYKK